MCIYIYIFFFFSFHLLLRVTPLLCCINAVPFSQERRYLWNMYCISIMQDPLSTCLQICSSIPVHLTYSGKQIKSKKIHIYRQKNAKLGLDDKMCAYRHCKTELFHLPLSATFTYFVIFRVCSQAIVDLCLNTRHLYICNNVIERESSFIHYRSRIIWKKIEYNRIECRHVS